jgi:tRNA(Ile)-lysidine synthase
MNSFLDKIGAGIANCGLRGTRVLVGVSGGADSVALLRGLCELQDEQQLGVVAAHLNHNLRGDASADDARWLEKLCARLGISVVVGSENVSAIAQQHRRGIEEAAREIRYEFLRRTAERERCRHVAVAHTADDQSETILHHVLRGTGISGLSGMSRVRPLTEQVQLVRPMLSISRADVETYLGEIGQEFRRDQSNLDMSFTRNRIRHALLPLLEREYNPQVAEALRRLGKQAGEVQAAIDELAGRLLDSALVDHNETICRVDCTPLNGEPVHLVRECFSLLWKRQNWPRRRMGFEEWNCLAALIRAEERDGCVRTLPGHIEAVRRGTLLVLRRMGG